MFPRAASRRATARRKLGFCRASGRVLELPHPVRRHGRGREVDPVSLRQRDRERPAAPDRGARRALRILRRGDPVRGADLPVLRLRDHPRARRAQPDLPGVLCALARRVALLHRVRSRVSTRAGAHRRARARLPRVHGADARAAGRRRRAQRVPRLPRAVGAG